MSVQIINADCREALRDMADDSMHCVVTSPPYWGLRDYGHDDAMGLEATVQEHVDGMVAVFREVRRVLRSDGTLWLNYGDCYTSGGRATFRSGASENKGHHVQDDMLCPKTPPGLKPKDLVMLPARIALALQADGWWLRSDIIWHKPNPMPESVTDRPTSAHEHLFLLTKSASYFYNADAVRETAKYPDDDRPSRASMDHARAPTEIMNGIRPRKTDKQRGHSRRHDGFNDRWDQMTKAEQQSMGRNLRNVWTIATAPFSEAHFATFPPALIEPCIKAGCPASGTVLDPFGGAGTTGLVAARLGRNAILIEINPEYAAMARKRIDTDAAKRGTGPVEIMRGDGMPLFGEGAS